MGCRESWPRRRLHKRHVGLWQHRLLRLGLCRGSGCSLLGYDGLPKGELSLSLGVPGLALRKLKCLLKIMHVHHGIC